MTGRGWGDRTGGVRGLDDGTGCGDRVAQLVDIDIVGTDIGINMNAILFARCLQLRGESGPWSLPGAGGAVVDTRPGRLPRLGAVLPQGVSRLPCLVSTLAPIRGMLCLVSSLPYGANRLTCQV